MSSKKALKNVKKHPRAAGFPLFISQSIVYISTVSNFKNGPGIKV